MKKSRILSFFIIIFLLIFTISVFATAVPGLRVDYHDNASLGSLVSEQTGGYESDNQE
jgi:hypothetical protein